MRLHALWFVVTGPPVRGRIRRLGALAGWSVAAAMVASGCGDPDPSSSVVSVSPAAPIVTAEQSPYERPPSTSTPSSSASFVPYSDGTYFLSAPPDTSATWPLDMPSGGVIAEGSTTYEFDIGEPDDIATRSVAVATATVTALASQPTGGGGGDVAVAFDVRVDDVLVGDIVDAGSEYLLYVGLIEHDGKLYQFEEDRLPTVGESYLMFLRVGRVDDIPAPGGQLRTTAASDGRIPLDEARADGLVDADRWRPTVATDVGCEFVDELRAAGYLRELPAPCVPNTSLILPTTAPAID